MAKSTVEQIRQRFDADVERFSNLETGNTAQVDSALSLEIIARAAASTNPQARSLLDLGCGAGNYTIKLLEYLPGLDVTLAFGGAAPGGNDPFGGAAPGGNDPFGAGAAEEPPAAGAEPAEDAPADDPFGRDEVPAGEAPADDPFGS